MMDCPVCSHKTNKTVISDPVDFEYFKKRSVATQLLHCIKCRSIFQAPFPTEIETKSFYSNEYQNYSKKGFMLSHLLKLLNDNTAKSFVEKWGKSKTVLDYGCGHGDFLFCLRNRGLKNVFGFEPNLKTTLTNNSEKIRILTNKAELVKHGPFDIIRLNHVIEHLVEIDKTMIFLKDNLSQNGCIILQTPNPNSITFKFFGRYWGPLHFPYHTVLFTKLGLNLASKRWGYKKIDVTNSPLMPTGWSMSVENFIKDFSKSKNHGRLKIYAIIALLCVPFAFIENKFRKGNSAILDYILYKGH